MQNELDQRVREALETPPLERKVRLKAERQRRYYEELEHLNDHIFNDLTAKEREYFNSKKWKTLQAKRRMKRLMEEAEKSKQKSTTNTYFDDELLKSDHDQFPGVFGLDNVSEGLKDPNKDHYERLVSRVLKSFGTLSLEEKEQYFYSYTKGGFKDTLETGMLPDGTPMEALPGGQFKDQLGVLRDNNGPFWPADFGPPCTRLTNI